MKVSFNAGLNVSTLKLVLQLESCVIFCKLEWNLDCWKPQHIAIISTWHSHKSQRKTNCKSIYSKLTAQDLLVVFSFPGAYIFSFTTPPNVLLSLEINELCIFRTVSVILRLWSQCLVFKYLSLKTREKLSIFHLPMWEMGTRLSRRY